MSITNSNGQMPDWFKVILCMLGGIVVSLLALWFLFAPIILAIRYHSIVYFLIWCIPVGAAMGYYWYDENC